MPAVNAKIRTGVFGTADAPAGTTRSRLPWRGSGGADGVHCLVEQIAERLGLV